MKPAFSPSTRTDVREHTFAETIAQLPYRRVTSFGLAGSALAAAALTLTGCGVGTTNGVVSNATSPVGVAAKTILQGKMMGGNQPITGATVQLYAAGTPSSGSGYGVGATPLIGSTVTTDASGNFSITGDYTCPTPAAQVYLVGTGGNPGLTPTAPATSISNGYIALMAALGTCPAGGTLTSTYPNLTVNEVTTVAAVWALQQFMAAPSSSTTGQPKIGAPTTSYSNGLSGASALSVQSGVIGMNNAFITAKVLADVTTGSSPNTNYAYATPEYAKIETIADILAYCVNSDPTQSTNCSQLMTAATPTGSTTAADTIQAAWYMAQNPINNLTTLYGFVGSTPPFASTYLAPMAANTTNTGLATNGFNDTTIAINYAPLSSSLPGVAAAYGVAIDAYGNAWLSNTGGIGGTAASAVELGVDGSVIVAPTTTYTVSTSGGAYSQFTTAPSSNTATFSTTKALAIDLNNNVWISNYGQATGVPAASSVAVFNGSTTSGTGGTGGGSGSTGYYVGEEPWGVAVDGSNNVFVGNVVSPSTSVMDGRSLSKFVASTGAMTFSNTATPTVNSAPNTNPGTQVMLAIDTNPNLAGGFVWSLDGGACSIQGAYNAATKYGVVGLYSATTGLAVTGSEIVSAASGATVGAGSSTNCGSTSTYVGQTMAADTANPYWIAIDKNNGAWLDSEYTSSLGFDGLAYISGLTSGAGVAGSSYYLFNGVFPTSSSGATPGTTLTKAGGVAVDGNNFVWIGNQTAKSIVEATLCTSATTFGCSAYTSTPFIQLLTPGGGSNYGTSPNNAAYGIGFVHNSASSTMIAIDPSGNIWMTNDTTSTTTTYTNQAAGTTAVGNSVTVIVGAAGPVVTPLSLAIHNSRLGQKP